MPDRAVITFPAAIFERDDFLVLALLDHFARHSRALDQRRAVSNRVAVAVKKDIREHALFAGFLIEEIDIDDVAFRDAMLSAASFDNCVSHTKKPGEKPRKVPQVRRFDKRKSGCGILFISYPASRITHPANHQRYLTFCRMRFVMGQQLRRRRAPELLEFLCQLAGDAQLAVGH